MVNGYGWIDEGQRIAEDTRRGGELDLAAIKASSIVFEQPLDTQTLEFKAPPPPQVGGFVEELHALKNEVDICRAGHCTSGYTAVRLGDRVKRLEAALREALTLLGEAV